MPQMFSFCSEGSATEMVGAITPLEGQLELLNAYLAVLASDIPRIKLFKNDVVPAVDSVLASFTEADFDGYLEVALAPHTAEENPQGWAQADFPQAHFEATGAVTVNTIFGYYITNEAETKVLKAERFATPVAINEAGDYIDIQTNLQLRSSSQAP